MKKICLAAILCAAMLALVACEGNPPETSQEPTQAPAQQQQDIQAPDDTQEDTQAPEATQEAQQTPEPKGIQPGGPTIQWRLETAELTVNVPQAWSEGAELIEMITENPDVSHFYAVAFAPEGVQLPQDANIGFFYVVSVALWDAMDGEVSDIPVNEIGRTQQVVLGFSGSSDNPYALGSRECELFEELMVPTLGSAEVFSLAQ